MELQGFRWAAGKSEVESEPEWNEWNVSSPVAWMKQKEKSNETTNFVIKWQMKGFDFLKKKKWNALEAPPTGDVIDKTDDFRPVGIN